MKQSVSTPECKALRLQIAMEWNSLGHTRCGDTHFYAPTISREEMVACDGFHVKIGRVTWSGCRSEQRENNQSYTTTQKYPSIVHFALFFHGVDRHRESRVSVSRRHVRVCGRDRVRALCVFGIANRLKCVCIWWFVYTKVCASGHESVSRRSGVTARASKKALDVNTGFTAVRRR